MRKTINKTLYGVNGVLYIKTSNTGPALLHTLTHCANITVNSTLQVKVFVYEWEFQPSKLRLFWSPFGNQLFWFTNQVASSKI